MFRTSTPPEATQAGFSEHRPTTARVVSMQPTRLVYALRWFALVAIAATLIAVGLIIGITTFSPRSAITPLGTTAIERSAGSSAAPEQGATGSPTAPAATIATEAEQNLSTVSVEADPVPARSSRLIAQEPERVLDTRDGQPLTSTDSGIITIDDGRTAVALSVTIMRSTGSGSVLIDGGAGVVEAATIADPGTSATNLIVVPVVGDRLTVRSSTGGHLIVDVVGTFEKATTATSGRFVTGPPTEIARLVTETDGRELTLPFSPSAPRGQADAVLVSITADVGNEGGTVRFGPTEGAFDQLLMWGPATADNNTRRGLALIQPSAEALTHLRYDGGSVLTAEIVGYFTNDGQPSSTEGLYVPTGPRQIFDGPLLPEEPVVIGDIEPAAATALVTVGSGALEAGALGSFLVQTDDGALTLSSESPVDLKVSLLGVFLDR